MKMNKKTYMIGGVVLIFLLIAGYLLLGKKNNIKPQTSDSINNDVVIPTVDQSVKVSFTSQANGHEVLLKTEGIPSDTQSVDYELSYQTAAQGLQGVIGTVELSGKNTFEKKLTLGTCSSGTCVYHQVVGKINLTLKFTGGYGEKIYQKDFGL